MNREKPGFLDNLAIAWAIGSKDIVDVLKFKTTLTNFVLLIGLLVFLYWSTSVRPWDHDLQVVVYDETGLVSGPDRITLDDGSELRLYSAASLEELKQETANRDLGIHIVAGTEVESGTSSLLLAGYVPWYRRAKVAELETQFSGVFSGVLGRPVQVAIGGNIVVPSADALGNAFAPAFHLMFAVFWLAFSLVPHLMIEERENKTMDVLMVSPASAGQVILGKGIAGLFYATVGAGISAYLYWGYVTNWLPVLLGFVCSAAFSIVFMLAIGGMVTGQKQLMIAAQPIIFLMIVPTFFYQEPNLAQWLRQFVSLLPTVAASKIIGYGLADSIPVTGLLTNIAITLAFTAAAYMVLFFQMRRADR